MKKVFLVLLMLFIVALLGAGLYSVWITWYIDVPGEAKILAFASIAIVTGFITLVLVKGKDVIH